MFVIQGHYSSRYGWEDLSEYDDRAEARRDLIEYVRASPSARHRIVERKQLDMD